MPYTDDSPQTQAAKASGVARRERAAAAKARAARHARYALGHTPGHIRICVCDECEALRDEVLRKQGNAC